MGNSPGVPGSPHGPRFNGAIDQAGVEARVMEARHARRGFAGDTMLAVAGALIIGAFLIGVGWRLVGALL